MRIKKEFIKAIAIAELSLIPIPAFAKKNTAVLSRTPNPPSEIGRSVTAPIIGIKTKK